MSSDHFVRVSNTTKYHFLPVVLVGLLIFPLRIPCTGVTGAGTDSTTFLVPPTMVVMTTVFAADGTVEVVDSLFADDWVVEIGILVMAELPVS